MPTRTLFHVSPYRINGGLIRVARCRTKIQCVWLCTQNKIGWALNHLPHTHGRDREEWFLYRVHVRRNRLRRRRKGIWMHFGDVRIVECHPVNSHTATAE